MDHDKLLEISEGHLQRAAAALDMMKAQDYQVLVVTVSGAVIAGTYVAEADHTGSVTVRNALTTKGANTGSLDDFKECPLLTVPGHQIALIFHSKDDVQAVRDLYEELKKAA
jgi:hypothetical protein